MPKMIRTTFSLLFCMLLVMSTATWAAPPLDTSLAPMLKKVLPAVVNIRAQIRITDFNTLLELQKQRSIKPNSNDTNSDIPSTFLSVGSGVIVDANNGYIITNAHVISDAQTIAVTLSDGRHFTAKTIGLDKPSDVALLQIKAKNLTAVPIGDSTKLKVGDFVAAIGNPFGLNQTVTSGIVSALGRTTLGLENFENFIQTDAPINPGNSGGALIDMQGNLVGINTAILATNRGSIGIGFAIPSNMAKSVMQQLVQFGNVKRGLLGVAAQDLTPELATAFNMGEASGAAITQVLANSPAQMAGIQVGDIIVAVNDIPVKNASDVINTIGFLRVDSKATIKVLRDKKPITLSVNLTDPSKRTQLIEQQNPFMYGVGMKNFSILSPVHGNVQGILVISVQEDSKAWQADLRPGDVIISVNQHKVKSIDEFKAETAKTSNTLLLNVIRGPGAIFLVLNNEA